MKCRSIIRYRHNSVIEDTHGFGPPFNPEEGVTAVIKLLESAGVRYSPKTSSDRVKTGRMKSIDRTTGL